MEMSNTLLYRPISVVGLVAESSPFCTNTLGEKTFLTVAVGEKFVVYDTRKLNIVLVSQSANGNLKNLQVYKHLTFASIDNTIVKYSRGKIVEELRYHESKVNGLLLIGSYLLSFDFDNNIKIFNIVSKAILSSFQPLNKSRILSIYHPKSYVNKVLVCFEDSTIELWNIRSNKLLHTFRSHKQGSNEKPLSMSCIEQSPDADVIAIGYSSGEIVLINLKLDITLFRFKQSSKVTTISFRNDFSACQDAMFASANDNGSLFIWKIENDKDIVRGSLVNTISKAHLGNVSKISFMDSEPILISASNDNSIKMWILESSDGQFRMLKSRQGFATAPQRIRLYEGDGEATTDYGGDGEFISVEGGGKFRTSRGLVSQIMQEYGTSGLHPKLFDKDCLDFAVAPTNRLWGTMVAIYKESSIAMVWNIKNRSPTKIALVRDQRGGKYVCSSVAVSACGNYGVVGYSDGVIVKYNLQSGLQRGSCNVNSASGSASSVGKATGLFIDSSGSLLLTGDTNGNLILWKFANLQVKSVESIGSAITLVHGLRLSSLVAIADIGGNVTLYDFSVGKVCRSFVSKSTERITDLAFSPDNRRLLSSSSDGSIQVFDISTGKCISWMKFEYGITSIVLSRSGELFYTCEGCRYIGRCIDASYFDRAFADNNSWGEPENPTGVKSTIFNEHDINHGDIDHHDLLENITNLELLESTAISYSNAPQIYWTTLCKQRSQNLRSAKKLPVVQEQTPFFLQSVPTLDGKITFSMQNSSNTKSEVVSSKILSRKRDSNGLQSRAWGPRSDFFDLLLSTSLQVEGFNPTETVIKFSELMEQMPPAKCEIEIQGLQRYQDNNFQLVIALLNILGMIMARGSSFELTQAYLHFTLSTYKLDLIRDKRVSFAIERLSLILSERSINLGNDIYAVSSMVKSLLSLPSM